MPAPRRRTKNQADSFANETHELLRLNEVAVSGDYRLMEGGIIRIMARESESAEQK